ncbi:pyocin activator PrtN family protein [Conchiformibius steedae]|uniref:pyocin activator PrtN family protein n=1 Tax=Conchiformibius steedae TaxID=153493 RepID=UPI0026EFCF73|nr:pyocin activator PrtN family protein [Conchiformibius steedae]
MTNQTETPSTAFILTMRYQSTTVALDEIVKHYLPHIGIAQAKRRAAEQTLPFPTFKADKNSHKSPYLVRVADVAAWLDKQAADAAEDWLKVNH